MSKVSPNSGDLLGYLKSLEKRLDRIERAPKGTYSSSPTFDGDLASNNPGSQGWALGPNSAAFGTLILRSSIIGNDALAGAVMPQVHDDDAAVSTVPHAATTVVSSTITVPAGFTQALVMAVGCMNAFNSTAGTDFLQIAVDVNGSTSSKNQGQALTGAFATVSNNHAQLLTGLVGGGTFTTSVIANVNGGTSWTTAAGLARISTTIAFLR